MTDEILLLRESDVRAAIDLGACIDAVERALAAYSTGASEMPGVIHLDVPEHRGEVHIKAGHLHGGRYYAAKFASGFAEPPSGAAAIDGLVAVFDATDGSPAAILFDNGYLTDLRTAAAGAVAARWLAPQRVRCAAVIGTGAQARWQLRALAAVRPDVERVRIWGRDPGRASKCAADIRRLDGVPGDVPIDVADSPRAAVEDADVVITCTASREPLVAADWLAAGAHVTALGSDGPGKQELDPDVLGRADIVAVDSRPQCAMLGELQHALASGAVANAASVVELGEIIAGSASGRMRADERTVCDLTGVGVQDVAAATVVVQRADAEDLGERRRR
jgi:ornithine cyclodeaminase/alanine dehydrogenase-like protein (mu-crystallin family)